MMTADDRTFVQSQLQAGHKPDVVAHALLMRRALEEVNLVAAEMAAVEIRQQELLDRQFYTVLSPEPEPVKVSDDGIVAVYDRQGRQEYRILVKDFPQFCKDMRLNHKEMEAVATGQQYEHKGWVSGGYGGTLYDMTRAGTPPNPRAAADALADAQIVAQTPKVRRDRNFISAPERIDWSPKK